MKENSASSPILDLLSILHVSVEVETKDKEAGAFPHRCCDVNSEDIIDVHWCEHGERAGCLWRN